MVQHDCPPGHDDEHHLRPWDRSLAACLRAQRPEDHQSVRFRLVSNGCTPAETRMLLGLCADDDRMEYLSVSSNRVLRHGTVLDELFQRERSPVFAFMDSDIFSSGNWFQDLVPNLRHSDAVFAGVPVRRQCCPRTFPEGFRLLNGAYDQMQDGMVVGNSYFAVYDRSAVSHCTRETGVTLNDYRWPEIPTTIRELLHREGKRCRWYETGKLMNIMLGLRGHRWTNLRLPDLWHISGMSSLIADRAPRRLLRALALRLLRRLRLLYDPLLHISAEERQFLDQFAEQREQVSRQFWAILQSLEDGQYPLARECREAPTCNPMARAEAHVREAYTAWRNRAQPQERTVGSRA